MISMLILFIGVLTSVGAASLVYLSNAHNLVKLSFLLIFLTLAAIVYTEYQLKLGSPIYARPHGDQYYIHHYVDGATESIAFWGFNEDIGHRLYIYPYSRDDAAKMESAAAKKSSNPILGFSNGQIDGSPIDINIPNNNIVKE